MKKIRKNSKKSKNYSIKAKPLINNPFFFTNTSFGRKPTMNYQMLFNYLRTSPEILTIIPAITEAIPSDGWLLKGGRNYKKRAEQFLQENFAKEVFNSFWIDALITGDAYLWKGKITPEDIRNTVIKNITFIIS